MTQKFRGKPLYVNAVQWFKMGDHPGVEQRLGTPEGDEPYTDGLAEAWGEMASSYFALRTPGGMITVKPGDWIVNDEDNRMQVCGPDVFAKAYEPVEPGPIPTIEVVRIPRSTNLDSITAFFEDTGPGAGRLTVSCFGNAWTAAWGSMGELTTRQFVAGCNAHYLSNAFLQLCHGNGRHREYTDRIAKAIIAHLAQPHTSNYIEVAPQEGKLNFRGETLEQAREVVVNSLKSGHSWVSSYARAYVDDLITLSGGVVNCDRCNLPIPREGVAGMPLEHCNCARLACTKAMDTRA